ncbi:hypothetical protein DV736_g1347, partial [Chaetothyriales sp. CBS 134916]
MSKNKIVVILEGTANYEEWYNAVKAWASGFDIWEYIRPDRTTDRPQEPTLKEFISSKIIEERLAAASSLGSVAQSRGPDLTIDEITKLVPIYKDQFSTIKRKWQRQDDALLNATNILRAHISKSLMGYIRDITSPKEIMITVKGYIGPTPQQLRNTLVQRYESLRSWDGTGSVQQFTLDWINTVRRMKELGIDSASEYTTRYWDFCYAVQNVDDFLWSGPWIQMIQAADKAESDAARRAILPPFEKFIKSFVNFYTTHVVRTIPAERGGRRRRNQYSANPMWGGTPLPANNQGQRAPHCPCGKDHFFSKCIYAIPELRPAGLVADPEIKEKFKSFTGKKKAALDRAREEFAKKNKGTSQGTAAPRR